MNVFAGLGIGLTAALLGSRAMTRLPFGVSPRDASTYVGVVCVIAAIAAAACVVPLYRTTQIDRTSALRKN